MRNSAYLREFGGLYELIFNTYNLTRKNLYQDRNTEYLKTLRENGQVIIPNFIQPSDLRYVQNWFQDKLTKGEFEFPVLANARIDQEKHKKYIDRYFLAPKSELADVGLMTTKKDFTNLDQFRADFNPSTLKIDVDFSDSILRELWLSKTILELVTDYMGFTPYVLEAFLRRNFPSKYKVMNHQWHRDSNHPFFVVKAFFFFTDCTVDSGPHEYVVGSHKDMGLNGKLYYTDEEVEKFKMASKKHSTKSVVKAGTLILEDTRGLHRAAIPDVGYRDLGYIIFAFPPMRKKMESCYKYKMRYEDYLKLSAEQKRFIDKKVLY